jgi:Mg2+/citrate symporter
MNHLLALLQVPEFALHAPISQVMQFTPVLATVILVLGFVKMDIHKWEMYAVFALLDHSAIMVILMFVLKTAPLPRAPPV